MKMKLVHDADGSEVPKGTILVSFRGDDWKFISVNPSPGSGNPKLYMESTDGTGWKQEFYLSVFPGVSVVTEA